MTWLQAGWEVFPAEPAIVDWMAAVRPVAMAVLARPDMQRRWLRHGDTWFAGVDCVPNDRSGAVKGGPALHGAAHQAALRIAGDVPLHRAQLSVTYPGYPKQDRTESDAAFGYRLRRDAAHVDGLLPIGPNRRRYLREPHAFILGLPLTDAGAGAAPLVVYEGSHQIMRRAVQDAFAGVPPKDWTQIDLTDAYQRARRVCFDTCRRVEITATPGAAILVHRLALHGIAPWAEGAQADPAGRMIAYFRPQLPHISDWLDLP